MRDQCRTVAVLLILTVTPLQQELIATKKMDREIQASLRWKPMKGAKRSRDGMEYAVASFEH